MATTNFIDYETVVVADWLNDVDEATYTTVPQHTTDIATAQATADNHIADTVGAHAATAVSNTPAGNIIATTVQAAIDELDTEKATIAQADFAANTHAATTKATPVDADELAIADSASSFSLKNLTWANLKATLLSTWKDATGGLVGLTLFKINFKNAANTFTSFLTNSNTASRTYTFPDYDATVATVAGTETLTNKTINLTSNTLVSTSAQLASALTDELGTGAALFGSQGTYTPTVFNTTNIAASTAYVTYYTRVGNMVIVSGRVDIDPTAAGAIQMEMTIPIASDIDDTLFGTFSSPFGDAGAVISNNGSDRARFSATIADTANRTYSFIFQYPVV